MVGFIGGKVLRSAFYRGLEALLLFGMHVSLSRQLGAEGYGVVSYAMFLMTVLALITPMGFTTSALRFVSEYTDTRDWASFRGFLFFALQVTIACSIVVAIFLVLYAMFFASTPDMSISLMWCAFLLPVFSVSTLRRKVSESCGQVQMSVLPDFVLPVVVILAALLGIVAKDNVVYVIMAGAVLANIVGIGLIYAKNDGLQSVRASKYKIRHWLAVSLPMVAAGLGNMLLNRADVLVLGYYDDMAEVGMYAAAMRVVMLISFVANAVYVVFAPMLSRTFYRGDSVEFVRQLRVATYWSIAGAGIGVVPLLAFPEFVLGLFGAEYVGAAGVLFILLLAQCVNVLVGVSSIALVLIGRERIFAYTTIAGAVINIVGNILVAPHWGGEGVAVVTLCTAVLLKFGQTYVLFSKYGYAKGVV